MARTTRSRIRTHLARKGIMSAVRPLASERRSHGVVVTQLKVADGYHQLHYALERQFSRLLAASMDRFLRRRPDMPFDHPRNRTRQFLYALPAFREWSAFMPNALALEPIHDPEQKRLVSGGWIDPVTRRLFRHGYDPVGIRTRTVTAAWLVHQGLPKSRAQVKWLSLAGGTGITGLLVLEASGVPKSDWHMTLVDMDPPALKIFKDYAVQFGLRPTQTTAIEADVLAPKLQKQLEPGSFDVVELMGIFEYFDHADSVKLLRQAYAMVRPGGLVVFANLRRKHPQLHLHKRGVGWPGVVPRSVADVVAIAQEAGIDPATLRAYQPGDGVYNVYQLTKAG